MAPRGAQICLGGPADISRGPANTSAQQQPEIQPSLICCQDLRHLCEGLSFFVPVWLSSHSPNHELTQGCKLFVEGQAGLHPGLQQFHGGLHVAGAQRVVSNHSLLWMTVSGTPECTPSLPPGAASFLGPSCLPVAAKITHALRWAPYRKGRGYLL